MSGIMNKLGLGHHSSNNTATNTTNDVAHAAGHNHTAAASHANAGQTTTTTTTTANPSVDLNRNMGSSLNNSSMNNPSLHQTSLANSALNNTTAPYGSSTNNMTSRTGAAYSGQTATSGIAAKDQGLFSQQNRLSGDDAMTRSEEQLHVAKATVASGVAALDKTVSVEHVEKAIPVQRERVVIEREPVTASNLPAAMKGPEISEAHYETTLREDRVAATKETVPVERIRLAKQVETKVESVGADLRKEHVDLTMQSLDNSKMDTTANRTAGSLASDKIDTHSRSSGLMNENSQLHNSGINSTTNTRNI